MFVSQKIASTKSLIGKGVRAKSLFNVYDTSFSLVLVANITLLVNRYLHLYFMCLSNFPRQPVTLAALCQLLLEDKICDPGF